MPTTPKSSFAPSFFDLTGELTSVNSATVPKTSSSGVSHVAFSLVLFNFVTPFPINYAWAAVASYDERQAHDMHDVVSIFKTPRKQRVKAH